VNAKLINMRGLPLAIVGVMLMAVSIAWLVVLVINDWR
jgi:hypothetical protein